MPQWTKESERDRRRALENIFMLAKRKRVVTHYYEGDKIIKTIGPKSDDADWDHIIRFCEEAGLQSSIIRAAAKGQSDE